jgi:hypothetical protein
MKVSKRKYLLQVLKVKRFIVLLELFFFEFADFVYLEKLKFKQPEEVICKYFKIPICPGEIIVGHRIISQMHNAYLKVSCEN